MNRNAIRLLQCALMIILSLSGVTRSASSLTLLSDDRQLRGSYERCDYDFSAQWVCDTYGRTRSAGVNFPAFSSLDLSIEGASQQSDITETAMSAALSAYVDETEQGWGGWGYSRYKFSFQIEEPTHVRAWGDAWLDDYISMDPNVSLYLWEGSGDPYTAILFSMDLVEPTTQAFDFNEILLPGTYTFSSYVNMTDFGESGSLDLNLEFTPIPEPSTCLLVGLGLICLSKRPGNRS